MACPKKIIKLKGGGDIKNSMSFLVREDPSHCLLRMKEKIQKMKPVKGVLEYNGDILAQLHSYLYNTYAHTFILSDPSISQTTTSLR